MTDAGRHPPTNYTPIIIVAALVALAINGALVGWALWVNGQRPLVELSQPILESDSTLCPEQTLNYKFTLSVSKAADVDLNTSVESVSPHNTIAYSRFQRYSFDTQTALEIGRQWTLPVTFLDPSTGIQRPWLPGSYIQRTSANIIGGRDAPAEIEVPFVIPDDCTH